MRYRLSIAALLCILLSAIGSRAVAQETGQPPDSIRTPVDTTLTPRADTLGIPPSATSGPSQRPRRPAGDDQLNDAVELSARDSLVITFGASEGDEATLYGEAQMNYQDATLKAHQIDMQLESSELHATGPPNDTASTQHPVFQRGNQEAFSGQNLAYNLRTQRGRVMGARRVMNQGFVRGDVVKVLEDSTLFVQGGRYTTCDCGNATPSYSLRSNRMKIANERWVYTGPIQLYLFNIPTPLWLPFGFLPATEGRRSGPLPPQYGEDERGFYLRDWGWYFALNDYMDLQVQGGLWSQGSWEVRTRYRYSKRYNYNGSFSFDFTHNRRGEEGDPDFSLNNQWQLRWNHDQTISPTSRFGGNLRFVSSSNHLRLDSEDFEDRVRQSISSNMGYSKRWPGGGRRLSLNMNHSQNFADGTVTLSFPSVSFSQSSFKPFSSDRPGSGRDEAWYERITTSYDGELDNQYTFDPLSDRELISRGDTTASGDPIDIANIKWYNALLSPSKFRRATGEDERFDFRATHDIPVSMSFFLPQYRLNISPRVSYQSEWLIRTERKHLQVDSVEVAPDSVIAEESIVTESVPGFFARREFNTGISGSTTFYGTFPIKAGAFEGLRHTVRPSLSFNYQPNFNSALWGYTRTFTNADGETVRYDIRNGRTVTGTSEQRSLSFSVNNVFETKRVRTDSTGERQENTLRLLNANVSTGYNFALDSLRMSNINLNARTDVIDQLNVSFNSTFSPYARDKQGRTLNTYMIEKSIFTPLRLTNLSLSLNTSFQGGERTTTRRPGGQQQFGGLSGEMRQSLSQAGAPYMTPQARSNQSSRRSGPFQKDYANFSIPWSIDLGLRYRLNKFGTTTNRNLTLDASFDFNLTPQWSIRGRSGYDFMDNEITTTNINISREFCCWMMSFSWYPFGQFQSYSFSLRLKSGPLSNLLRLNLPNANPRGRFGNVIRQGARGGFR